MSKGMQQNATQFEWNSKRLKAASLVSEDKLSDDEIAKSVEVNRTTLHRWKQHPEFQAKVQQIIKEAQDKVIAKGVADRQNRVDALNDRWKRMREVINQRAEVYANEEAGGNTGLIVKQVKGIGKGADFQIVEMFAVDTGLLKELREHEKQAAQELGQWVDKQEHSFDLSNLTNEDLLELERLRSKLNT